MKLDSIFINTITFMALLVSALACGTQESKPENDKGLHDSIATSPGPEAGLQRASSRFGDFSIQYQDLYSTVTHTRDLIQFAEDQYSAGSIYFPSPTPKQAQIIFDIPENSLKAGKTYYFTAIIRDNIRGFNLTYDVPVSGGFIIPKYNEFYRAQISVQNLDRFISNTKQPLSAFLMIELRQVGVENTISSWVIQLSRPSVQTSSHEAR